MGHAIVSTLVFDTVEQLSLPDIAAIIEGVERILHERHPLLLPYLVLTHAHALNQSEPAATFSVHVDTEDNRHLQLPNPRCGVLTAVILLRKGWRPHDDKGCGGVKVWGGEGIGLFDVAGVVHVFLQSLYHETVGMCDMKSLPEGQYGDLKLTLFWGLRLTHMPK
jgi:hypothetical protein